MTSTQLTAIKNGIVAIPNLFAYNATGDGNILQVPDTHSTDVCFKNGYPAGYDNTSGSDKAIERNKFNWLLRAFSQASYFGQTGIKYTYNSAVSNAIGGYPLGAVLAHDDGTSTRNVVSLVDNNTYDFVTNGVDNQHWKYLDPASDMGIYPDYGSSSYLIYALIPVGTGSITQVSDWIPMPKDGWIYPQFTLLEGITTYLVLGPADGSVPSVDFSGNEYTDMVPDEGNSKSYTAFLLGNNLYSNKNLIPVKEGTKIAVFGMNTSSAAGASAASVWVRIYRNYL